MSHLLLLLLLIQMAGSESVSSPKLWLNLQFSSTHPVDDLRLKDPPRNFYTRDDLEGTHTLAIDDMPAQWHLEISNELDNTSLSLTPSWDSQRIRFNIRERTYELSYKVTCKMGFYGEKCDRMCIPTPERHYSCSAKGEKICQEGWTGEDCEKNACTANPCVNGGICSVEGLREFSCSCERGFEGRLCERRNPAQMGGGEPREEGASLLEVLFIAFCVVLLVSMLLLLLFFRRSQATLKRKETILASPWQTQDVEAVQVERLKAALPV